MINREEVLRFLDTYLDSPHIEDVSHNGLQVEGTSRIGKIIFGVSASLELFKKAEVKGADMIIVHHGLLWGKEQAITGMFRSRIAYLLQYGMNLVAYHLPLDKHPVVGHNACLIKALIAQKVQPFGAYHGMPIGYSGEIAKTPLTKVVETLENLCEAKAKVLGYGPTTIEKIAIVSGGAYSILPQAIEKKMDLYVTGVLDEPAQEWCREGNINCVALGHYNSEKIGILALMDLVAKHFNVETEFIDIPNSI